MLLVVSFVMTTTAALPDALFALWLKVLAQGVLGHHRGQVLLAAAGLGASSTGGWFLRVVGDRMQRRFRDRATIVLEAHVARLQASVATIEHHERPEYLDRLAVLRDQVFTLSHLYMSLFSTAGWLLRLPSRSASSSRSSPPPWRRSRGTRPNAGSALPASSSKPIGSR